MNIAQLLVLLLLAAIWGASFLFMRVAVQEFGAISLIMLRVGGAALLLLPFLYWRGYLAELKGNCKHLFILGITNAGLPFTLFAYATSQLTAGFTSVLNSLAPMFTALIGYLWLKQKLSMLATLGLLLGLVGVMLLVQDKSNPGGGVQWFGIAAGISASFLYGFAANYAKHYKTNMSPIAITGGHLLAAALCILPFGIYFWPETSPSALAWGNAFLLAVLCTALAHFLYFWLLQQVSAHSAVSVTFLIPVFGMFWGAVFLQEVISLNMILGCGIILIGVALTTGVLGKKAA